jgi:hypothetical protein
MGIAFHVLYAPDGMSPFAYSDRVYFARKDVVYSAGTGAGAAVTTSVSWSEILPSPFAVSVGLGEDATASVTGATYTGFQLVVRPRLASSTLAGGIANCIIVS